MILFKKNKAKQNNVTVKKTSNTKVTRTDQLKVELVYRNYIIFSDSTSKYLCFDNDFDNPIIFDDYIESIQGVVILKKGDVYALSYLNSEENKYELTDFIFTDIKEENHLLLLQSNNGKKHIYCYYTIYSDICDYILYDLNDEAELILIKYIDHEELYEREFYGNLKLMFSAKNIELCTLLIKTKFNYTAVFKYSVEGSSLINYFLLDCGYVSDIKNTNNYFSLDTISYKKNRAAIIGTNKHGKKRIFDIYSPDKVSKYYDNIQNAGELFLCQKGKHAEIIDIDFNVYYYIDFRDDLNLTLHYEDNTPDTYILNSNNQKFRILHIYSDYFESFYSIFEPDERYGTLYSFKPKFYLNNFIRKCEYNIFEFEDGYLFKHHNCYILYTKEIQVKKLSKDSDSLYFEHIKDIFFVNDKDETVYLTKKQISLLEKCKVSDIKTIYLSNDNSIIIKASNSICDITISTDKIRAELITNNIIELNVSDIKTNLIDYIFEHINNKFSIALLKDKLK